MDSGLVIYYKPFVIDLNGMIGRFYTEGRIIPSRQKDNASSPFYTIKRPVIRLDELGQTFVVRLVMKQWTSTEDYLKPTFIREPAFGRKNTDPKYRCFVSGKLTICRSRRLRLRQITDQRDTDKQGIS